MTEEKDAVLLSQKKKTLNRQISFSRILPVNLGRADKTVADSVHVYVINHYSETRTINLGLIRLIIKWCKKHVKKTHKFQHYCKHTKKNQLLRV